MFKFWKRDKISTLLTDTFIGEGTIVEGAIRSAGSVRVEGQLRGDIFAEGDVVLGESAFAISNITARNVFLAGQVTGNVRISGKLTITATGKLYGDLDAATIAIEEGGVFQGNSAMDMGEPVVSPVERRHGRDRRVAADPNWNGEERRSGYDRRDKEAQSSLMIKKISYRAPEKKNASDVESNGADAQVVNETQSYTDPLRENGRAFMQNMNAGRKQDKHSEGVSDEERAALGVPGQAAGQAASSLAAALAEAAAASEDAEAASAIVDVEAAGAIVAAVGGLGEDVALAESADAEAEDLSVSAVELADDEDLGILGMREVSGDGLGADGSASVAAAVEWAEAEEWSVSARVVDGSEEDAAMDAVVAAAAGLVEGNALNANADSVSGLEENAEPAAVELAEAGVVSERADSIGGFEEDASASTSASAVPIVNLGADLAGLAAPGGADAVQDAAGSEEATGRIAALEAEAAAVEVAAATPVSGERVPLVTDVEGSDGWTIYEPLQDGHIERPLEQPALAKDIEADIWDSSAGFGIVANKPSTVVIATTASPANGAPGTPVKTPSSAYAFGFEERANAGTSGEQTGANDELQHSQPANSRKAEEAAALLRNW